MSVLRVIEEAGKQSSGRLVPVCDVITVDLLDKITCLEVNKIGQVMVGGFMEAEDDGQTCHLAVFTESGMNQASVRHNTEELCQMRKFKDSWYLGDWGGECVYEYNKRGVIRTIRATDALTGNIGLDVHDGKTYITSEGVERVYCCGPRGEKAQPWSDSNIKLASPYSLAINQQGHVAVSCVGSNSVVTFDEKGKQKFKFGTHGSGDGALDGPRGVAWDSEGRLYVADHGNDRICVVSPEGKFLCHLVTMETHGLKNPVAVKLLHDEDVVAVAFDTNHLLLLHG